MPGNISFVSGHYLVMKIELITRATYTQIYVINSNQCF